MSLDIFRRWIVIVIYESTVGFRLIIASYLPTHRATLTQCVQRLRGYRRLYERQERGVFVRMMEGLPADADP